MISLLKALIAVLLIPAVWGTLHAFIAGISMINPSLPEHRYFFIGIIFYLLFQVICSQPLRTYVFGHELTHALASLMIGGKIKHFKVSKKGGSVTLSKTNFFVSLAPYCIPLYTLLLLAGYGVLGLFIPIAPYQNLFLFLVGFTLAFHFALTVFAMKQRQPDITQTGIMFSMVFIGLVALWVVMGILKIIFPAQILFSHFMKSAWAYSVSAYSTNIRIVRGLLMAAGSIAE